MIASFESKWWYRLPGRIPHASAISLSEVRRPEDAKRAAAVSMISSRRAPSVTIGPNSSDHRSPPRALKGGRAPALATKRSVRARAIVRRMPDIDDRSGAPLAADPELARNPQPTYRSLVESTPAFRMDGVGVVAASRAAADAVLRHPDVFSSNMSAIDLKTRRPLIPMSIDPPAHRKYRKLLDPLFAPQRMKPLEQPVTRLANELIDGFMDDGEVDFVARFSVPLPSQVFLTMLGLPLEELPRFLEMKGG